MLVTICLKALEPFYLYWIEASIIVLLFKMKFRVSNINAFSADLALIFPMDQIIVIVTSYLFAVRELP